MTSSHSITKVVIVGRDAAAWISAVALTRALGPAGVCVEVVELPSLLSVHDAYAALPSLDGLHRLLGIEEITALRQCAGTISLGQSFANFARSAPPFFHPYSGHGTRLSHIPFLQYWLKAHESGLRVPFEDFAINSAAAKAGRFSPPDLETTNFTHSAYGYHFHAQAYVSLLKTQAARHGVKRQLARNIHAKIDPATGNITAVTLGDGKEVTGDLFIDATGQDSLLLSEISQEPIDSWVSWFPDDRILTMSAKPMNGLPPFSQVRALAQGVLHLVPLQDMTSVSHIYNHQSMKDDAAFEAAVSLAGRPLREGAVVSALNVGRRGAAWVRNCVAIGEAACVLNPIDHPVLQTIHLGIAHLVDLFPLNSLMAREVREYNMKLNASFERIRDFQICHYKLNRNFDQPVWDGFRAMDIPDRLSHKLSLFAARGMVAMYEDETFETDDWASIMLGHGLMPLSYDPLVDLIPENETIQQFQQILGFIGQKVKAMDAHEVYIEMNAAKQF